MRSIELALQGGAKVLTAGLIFGAGLPILYALAVRSLAVGASESVADDGTIRHQRQAHQRHFVGPVLGVRSHPGGRCHLGHHDDRRLRHGQGRQL